MMADAQGRWFSFAVVPETVILLEKKGVPEHVQNLPCIDSPTPLSTVLRELEDAGEVRGISKKYVSGSSWDLLLIQNLLILKMLI